MVKKQIATNSSKLSFLKEFNAGCGDMEGIAMSSPAPKFWLDTGSFVINKVLSGSYQKGIPTGRLAAFAGPSGAGKSFLLGNVIKSALNNTEREWGVLVLDSENALDDDYLTKIGANVINNPLYTYRGISSISQALYIVSKFTKAYRAANEDIPFLIAIDSLDNLHTDSELEQYAEGEMKGDRGQQAKQIKAMLKRFVNDIKGLNIAMVHVKQVFQEQDPITALNNPWKITESVKFAYSQIGLVTRLLLKDKSTNTFEGIKLKVKGEKTRFSKPYQQCTVEVPYETGMDRYTGILEAAVAMGIVEQNGAWHSFDGQKFYRAGFDERRDAILQKLLEKDSQVLNVQPEEEEDLTGVLTGKEIQIKRKTTNATQEPTDSV